jgi:hypothetical protein
MKFKIILLFIVSLLIYSCNENSNPTSPLSLEPHFVVDTLSITANPDSVKAKLIYHFEGSPGYLSSYTIEVYYSGNTEAYGIHPNGPIDSVGIYCSKNKVFSLYYTPAVGYTTYAKCKLTGSFVTLTENGWIEAEPFTWSDSSSIIISQ